MAASDSFVSNPINCNLYTLTSRMILWYATCIQLFQLTLSDQSLKLELIFKEAATSSFWYPNISFIQMARHRISSLEGRGIADFDELIHKKIHRILRSCLTALYFDQTTLIEIAVSNEI